MVKLPDPLARIAATLDAVLRARHWKKTAFAHGKVSTNTVRNVLQGKDHRLSTLIALAEALECDLVIDLQPRQNSQSQADAQDIAHD